MRKKKGESRCCGWVGNRDKGRRKVEEERGG